MIDADNPRVLTDVHPQEVAIFSNDGRVFYNMQAMATQWTMALVESKMRAITEQSSPETQSHIAGQAYVLSMILENIDILLAEAGMPEFALGMGDFDQMIQHFTSE